jgi:sugar phosphate isomerase/epimerase
MQIGIFARTFSRPTLEETLDAVAAHGLTHVQFNMSCAGLPTLSPLYLPEVCERVAVAFAARG